MLRNIIIILYASAFCADIDAQEMRDSEINPDAAQDENKAPVDESFFRQAGKQTTFYLGRFEAAEEPQFRGVRAQYTFGLGVSAELAQYPNLALDLELFDFHREFDTTVQAPLLSTINNDTSADTLALLFGARAFYPASSSFRAYVSAGLGYFNTRLVVTGSTFGLPGTMEQSSSSLDIYYGAGISYSLDKWGIGLDYRRVDIEGSFSDFYIDDADLGGDALLLGVRYHFD